MTVACESSAAYVLGALTASERSAFEEHLAGCAECQEAVAGMAGIPGLLSRVSPADLADPLPVPDTLVPGLLRAVRRSGRRRRVVVGMLSAAAVVLAVAGTALVVDRSNDGPSGASMTAMTAVVDSPVSASASLVAHTWGTEVHMTCRYADASEWSRPYDLVAVDDDGTSYDLATWVVGPGKTASVSGSVPVQPDHIDRLEIRLASGQPILRLTP
ncbi:MAG TPA: zf-HC2 domain-containing protein [Marmoricola sp.]|jgi:anti-sigma-K factor RskA|nr:zf-HC2 domain-containing protein [Marmoricola sp.]